MNKKYLLLTLIFKCLNSCYEHEESRWESIINNIQVQLSYLSEPIFNSVLGYSKEYMIKILKQSHTGLDKSIYTDFCNKKHKAFHYITNDEYYRFNNIESFLKDLL